MDNVCNVRLEADGERREGDSRRFISRKHVGILIRDFALCEVMRRTVEKGMNILVKFVFYFKSRFFCLFKIQVQTCSIYDGYGHWVLWIPGLSVHLDMWDATNFIVIDHM